MRKLAALTLFTMLICAWGCKKDDTPPTQQPPAKPSKLSLFTQKKWIYDELYNNYNGTTGTLMYKRGVSVDPNRDKEIDIYWPDGTGHQIFDYTATSTSIQWKVLDKDTTRLTFTVGSITNPVIIQVLDSTHYQYYDSVHHIQGKMIWLY